ncbi:MAG: hypothetical protein V1874_11015 [Spirochaetota bacterium]
MGKLFIIFSSLILIFSTTGVAYPATSDMDSEVKDIQKYDQNIEAEPAGENGTTDAEKHNIGSEPVKQIENQDIIKPEVETTPVPVQQTNVDQSIKKETQAVGEKNFLKYLNGLEIFFLPAATFYNNATGMDINLGIFTDMSLFGLTDYKKNIVLGGSGLWHRVSNNDTTVSTFGVYGIAGYQFFLKNYIGGLPWYEDVRFIVQSRIGIMDQNISGDGKSNGAAVFVAPALTADIKLTDIPLRLGIDVSYNIYLGDQNLRSVSTGLYASYRF